MNIALKIISLKLPELEAILFFLAVGFNFKLLFLFLFIKYWRLKESITNKSLEAAFVLIDKKLNDFKR